MQYLISFQTMSQAHSDQFLIKYPQIAGREVCHHEPESVRPQIYGGSDMLINCHCFVALNSLNWPHFGLKA